MRRKENLLAKKTLNPGGMPMPRGSYSQVVISKPGRAVFIAGNTASDPNGNVVEVADVRARPAISRKDQAAGGNSTGSRIDDRVHHRRSLSCRCERSSPGVPGSDFPASTMVQVVALARPELLLEINAVAIVPESSVKDNS